VHYAQPFVHALSGLLLLLLVVFGGVAMRNGARPAGVAGGLAVTVGIAAAGFGLGTALVRQVVGRHGEVGALHGSLLHAEGWYVLSVVLALLGITLVVTTVARRWISRDELALGALILPAVAAVAVAVAVPLAAAHLQFPVIAATLAALVASVLGARAIGGVGWVVSVFLALPVLLVLQPVFELVWLALTLQLLGGLGVLAAVLLVLCLPALEFLRAPNVWWAPAGMVAAAGVAFGLGVLGSRPSPERPLPTTLAYAYEHGSGEALWITAAGDEGRPGVAERVAWAEARAGGSFDESRDLSGFGYWSGVVPVRRAPVVSASPPDVQVLRDSIVGSERSVRLSVRSVLGAEMLGFEIGEGTRLRAINDVPIENADALRRADHWGEPDGAVLLDLTMPADEPIGVHVLEHLLRPWELLGDEAFERTASQAPNVNRLSDRAMMRYSVAAFVDPRHAFLRPTGRPDTGIPVDSLQVGTPPMDTMQIDTMSVLIDTMAAPVDTAPDSGAVIDTTGMGGLR
jgi:hypothetical protein